MENLKLRFHPNAAGHGLRGQMVVGLQVMQFKKYGGYEIHVLVDGRTMAEIPFRVVAGPDAK